MADYKEKDVTDLDAAAIVRLINSRLRTNASVEFVMKRGRLIMRTWITVFDVSEYEGETEA